MQFLPTHYLEAVKQMDFSGIECNLAFSDAQIPFSLADLSVTDRVFESRPFHSYGDPDLKSMIAARYGVDADQVLIPGGGSSLCNFLLAAAILGTGDKALMEFPTYEPLRALVRSTGAEIINFSRPPQRNYDIDFDEYCELLQPPVKLVILTRLHNPSGQDIPADLLVQMAEKAGEICAYILVDEVYLDVDTESSQKPAVTLHPQLLTTNSLTKVYGWGSLRFGWALAPKEIIWKSWRINNILGVNPPAVQERIAAELFRNGSIDKICDFTRRRSDENLAILEKWIAGQLLLSWFRPKISLLAMLQLKHQDDSEPLTDLLFERHSTAVMPGKYFGIPNGFRIGLGCPPEQLEEGLHRIGLALSETYG